MGNGNGRHPDDTAYEELVTDSMDTYVQKLIAILDDPDFIEGEGGLAPILITRRRFYSTMDDSTIVRLTKMLHRMTAIAIGISKDD